MNIDDVFLSSKNDTKSIDEENNLQKLNYAPINLISVSVNYADYLEDTLRYNHKIFDLIYIITIDSDKDTINICNQYNNVICVQTKSFYGRNKIFNKGAGLNYCLSSIERSGWCVIGDADCVFPKKIKNDIIHCDTTCLYTYNRGLVKDKQHLKDIMNNIKTPNYYHNGNIHRILGYCQLFNFASPFFPKNEPFYPTRYKNAAGSDIDFSNHWPRNKKIVIRSSNILHLGPRCVNWNGRKSPIWN